MLLQGAIPMQCGAEHTCGHLLTSARETRMQLWRRVECRVAMHRTDAEITVMRTGDSSETAGGGRAATPCFLAKGEFLTVSDGSMHTPWIQGFDADASRGVKNVS